MKNALHDFFDDLIGQRERFIMLLPVLFACGIGFYFALPYEPPAWAALVLIETLIVLAYFFRFKAKILVILGVIGITALGFADIQLQSIFLRAPDNLLYSEDEIYLKGRILNIDHNYKGKTRILIDEVTDFNDKPITGTYRITLNHNYNSLKIGECTETYAKTFPLMHPNIVGGYQFDRKAYFAGINALGFAMVDSYPVDCKVDKNTLLLSTKSEINSMRKNIVNTIEKELPANEAAVASALIAGDKSLLNKNLIRQYQDSGLAHFLAISGLHMGMIAFLMFFFIRTIMSLIPRLALRFDSKKAAASIAILLSFIYFMISGAQIPAQRAFIMTTIILLGILFNREAISLRSISLAAFVVLLISPQALISASFQMSFAAVLMLVVFYETYSSKISHFFSGGKFRHYVIGYFCGIIITDFIATIATLPFTIYHFNRIAIYTSLGNFLAGPVIGFVVMPFILLTLIALPLGIAKYPLSVVEYGLRNMNDITSWVSSLPGAGYKIVSMPFWGFMLIIFGGLWLCFWENYRRRWGIIPIIIGFMSILTVKMPDFIVNSDADLFAVSDNKGNLVILPSRGDNFTKEIWLERNAQDKLSPKQKDKINRIYAGTLTDKDFIKLECNEESCIYKNRIVIYKSGGVKIDGKVIDTKENLGFSAYITDNKIKIKSVRDYIGHRPWNKN